VPARTKTRNSCWRDDVRIILSETVICSIDREPSFGSGIVNLFIDLCALVERYWIAYRRIWRAIRTAVFTTALRTRAGIGIAAQADAGIARLNDEKDTYLRTELQKTSAQLKNLQTEIVTQRSLLLEAESVGAADQSLHLDQPRPRLRFSIMRQTGSGSQKIDAGENDTVVPGDVVIAERYVAVGQGRS